MKGTTVHLVTSAADPRAGGMETSVMRIAGHLVDGGAEVIVYGLRDRADAAEAVAAGPARGIAHEPLGDKYAALAAPIDAGGASVLPFESYQIDCALLRNALRRRLRERPAGRHLLVSFFITHAGWVAHRVGAEAGLGHLASVRGSDLTRDYFDPFHAPGFCEVVRDATLVVATNQMQAAIIEGVEGAAPVEVIANSVSVAREWTPPEGTVIELVSDCGYSFRKGTHVLVRAVVALADAGAPIRLRLVGRLEAGRRAYWEDFRRRHASHPALDLGDAIPANEVGEFLAGGHVYCSATLGEGSSNSRLAAAAMGMPIVSTACGTLGDVAAEAAHVSLAAPCDVAGFEQRLADMVDRIRDDRLTIDGEFVARLRDELSPEVERRAWRAAVRRALVTTGT